LCLAFLLIFPPFLSPPFRLFPTSHVFGFQTVCSSWFFEK
jgi:hypothetical protein